ncbi:MAG: hypothetical protein ABR570_17370 [Burkholderiales bacterium]
MKLIRIGIIIGALSSPLALAQTPGLGDTRPAPPARDDTPPGDAKEPLASPSTPRSPGHSDRDSARCEQLTGALHDVCLREERSATGGATRRAEPPTAPPPQNPR